MQFNLVPHPSFPVDPGLKLWVNIDLAAAFGASATLNMWFGVGAAADRFALPASGESRRAEDLWQTTCFELFLKSPGTNAYREWNFAPSTEWAAYDFAGYREGRVDSPVNVPPYVRMEDNLTWWTLGATIAVEAEQAWEIGLSAILEDIKGGKSYWALAHPPGGDPDFHHRDCFAARLA